jgi:uncharacterized protein YjbI with pentapeptide repeats
VKKRPESVKLPIRSGTDRNETEKSIDLSQKQDQVARYHKQLPPRIQYKQRGVQALTQDVQGHVGWNYGDTIHRGMSTRGAVNVLREADLTGADLTGADLTGADLTGADLTGADLSGADLSGAKGIEAIPPAAIPRDTPGA